MTCADVEILICDYLDGTLDAARKGELERHLAACEACAALARDAGAAVTFLEKVSDVEPPPELVTRILFDRPWTHHHSGVTTGSWFRRLMQPVLQPRFAMGMAMTILSLAMLARFVTPMRQLTPADLNPVRVWETVDNRIYRVWERSVKYYDSIRFVYQIRSRLRDWQQQQQEEEQAAPVQPEQQPDSRRLPIKSPPATQSDTAEKSQ